MTQMMAAMPGKPEPRRDSDDAAFFWDKTARRYAESPIKDKDGYERTLAETRRWLLGPEAALEIGCGTGMTALRLAPFVAELTATDVSPGMISIAQERAAKDSAWNTRFLVTPAERLPAEDASLDVVLAFNLLHLVKDRDAVLAEVRRVLKPDGLFISKTPCLSEMSPLIGLAVPLMQWLGKAPHVSFFDALELERDLARAGLETLECARHGSKRKDARIFLVARKTG
jgi:ubiquinone/menaquinone biosynthesis C-methylase UbiE